jgi:hypothetical protein
VSDLPTMNDTQKFSAKYLGMECYSEKFPILPRDIPIFLFIHLKLSNYTVKLRIINKFSAKSSKVCKFPSLSYKESYNL